MNDIKSLNRLIDEPLQPNPTEWAMDAKDVLLELGLLSDEAQKHIENIKQYNGAFSQNNDALTAILKRALKKMNNIENTGTQFHSVIDANTSNDDISNYSIFIVHGHDAAMKSEVARVLEQQGLDALVLSEQPTNGMTIIEKLEHYAQKSAFAVVLYSKDDISETGERARQNVVFEHGLFIGHLGRSKVIAMKNGDVEGYSDIAGVEYIHYENQDWKYKLVDALKLAGFNVSRDRIK